MFSSFFPSPRLFFSSVVIWTFVCIGGWYAFAADLGALLGFASGNPTGEVVIGVGHFFTPEYIWFDIYYAAATALFATAWHRLQPHAWAVWSIIGSSFLIFLAYTSVQGIGGHQCMVRAVLQ
jgi:peptide/bleomycin uptake transporter